MRRLRQVRPEDFDVEALRVASQEGRLHVEEVSERVCKEDVKKEVRAYVQRIRTCVTIDFSLSVDELWEQILGCDDFIELLTPGNKSRKCREFDKYSVMRIIGVLREKGVYEYYNDSKYNSILEQTNKDTSYRKYLSMGLEQRHLLLKLREIVSQCQL